tara:strand:- start:3383 stop:3565 length:183 start_codon:yes stop_codon:yes gene_type:complete
MTQKKTEQSFIKQINKCLNELSKLKNESFRLVPQAYCLSAFVLLQQARQSLKEEILNEDN